MTAFHSTAEFSYRDADYEDVPCNLCGNVEAEPFCSRDRNGLPVRSVLCKRCGLAYLSPRMTSEWYGKYYEVEYRRQMSRFKGTRIQSQEESLTKYFEHQYRRGAWLAKYLRDRGVAPKTILDVGSSTGGILKSLQEEFGADVLGIEPSPDEAGYAQSKGIPSRVGLFEMVANDLHETFDLILCTQSYNHLLDPRGVTQRIRACLNPNGQFFLECLDFFMVCQSRSAWYEAVQIDHVYMFVPQTIRGMLEVSGFGVVPDSEIVDRFQSRQALADQKQAGMPCYHVRLLATQAEPAAAPSCSYAEVRAELHTMPNSPFLAAVDRQWKGVARAARAMARRLPKPLRKMLQRTQRARAS